ncbi:FISUMP domain-containing protein [uncultured Sphingobacterium sp.]|uniref:FISUMP domain-containing protein n=1 Tax=uncultured Sphingobacterium sp. TaxID=182688 RepID=UPI0025E426B4|nr:FISUMP domain-containing protein [uncultured Sphingobacterium sp.]
MKTQYIYFFILLLFMSCTEKIAYVNPTWVQQLLPMNSTQIKIDYFDNETMQEFSWVQREGATYTLMLDVDENFGNPIRYEVGAKASYKITNQEFLDDLKRLNPSFKNSGRFFWKLEQRNQGKVESVWRYFDALVSVSSFVDPRDQEHYKALQFVLPGGKLVTMMSENLRAKVYADGTALPLPRKLAPNGSPAAIRNIAGGFYPWGTVVRDEATAREKTLAGEHIQGICPDGWHVPALAEWKEVINYLGPNSGNKVKNPQFWIQNGAITDEVKFNIVPSGFYWNEGLTFLTDPGTMCGFWTSSPALKGYQYSWETLSADRAGEASAVIIYNDPGNPDINTQSRSSAGGGNFHYNVRCIMN